MRCPCKGCPKAGCGSFHDECELYREWKKLRAEANKVRVAEVDTRCISKDHERKYRKNLKAGRVRK